MKLFERTLSPALLVGVLALPVAALAVFLSVADQGTAVDDVTLSWITPVGE